MSRDFDSNAKHGGAHSQLQGMRALSALEAVKGSLAHGAKKQRSASALVSRQHEELDAAHEAGQRLGARGRDLRNSLQLVREAVDRAKLTALNAGLEGARLGEPAGKALVTMGDEVRNLLARAVDSLEEHAALLADVDRERERCLADLAKLSDAAREANRELSGTEEQLELTTALVGELGIELAELGTDPDAARLLAQSASQVKDLASSLVRLSARAPLDVNTLRELLDPLLSLVAAPGDAERQP